MRIEDKPLANLKREAFDNCKTLSWSSFPWPVFYTLDKPEELNQDEVKIYLRLLPQFWSKGSSLSKEDCLREQHRRWHPDRFESKWLARCAADERVAIKEGVGLVARALSSMLEARN